MLPSLLVGFVVLPYATLWATRSARLRAAALAVARRRWQSVACWLGVVVGLLSLGAGGVVPAIPPVVAWVVTTLAFTTFAHVELLVAAAAMRSYPDDRALHYDLTTPRTWPATSAYIVSAWGVVMRRHRWLWPAVLACSALFALGPQFLDTRWWLALAADALVLGLCCLPFPRLVALPARFDGDLPADA